MFSAVDVHSALNRIISHFPLGIHNLPLIPVKTFYDLPVTIIDQAIEQKAENTIDGVRFDSKVYVVLDRMLSPEHVEKTLFQEFTHEGLSRLAGCDIETSMNKLFNSIGGWSGMKKILSNHNINLNDS